MFTVQKAANLDYSRIHYTLPNDTCTCSHYKLFTVWLNLLLIHVIINKGVLSSTSSALSKLNSLTDGV